MFNKIRRALGERVLKKHITEVNWTPRNDGSELGTLEVCVSETWAKIVEIISGRSAQEVFENMIKE